jgi:hypothetical protein
MKYLTYAMAILLLVFLFIMGIISFSANDYRVSIDFNYGELTKKFKQQVEIKQEEIND